MAEENFVRKSSETSDSAKRQVSFPDLPEPLEVAIYDNHTHLEFQFVDELPPMPVSEHLDKAASVGIKGVVQVGVTLAGFLSASFGGVTLSGDLAPHLVKPLPLIVPSAAVSV